MRRSSVFALVLITLFVLSLASPYDLDTATDTSLADPSRSDLGLLSEGGTAYTGVGSALDISFSGTFTNNSPWSSSSNTLSELLTPGASFLVENSTLVTWTAYVLVSPPSGVNSLNFSVDYSLPDWRPISVKDPLGTIMTNPTDWHYEAGILTVESSAITIYGLWKVEFVASNHLENLLLGPNSQSLSSTGTFDTSSTIDFQVTSSWITGSTAELTLIDPTGTEWTSVSNSTSDPTSHLISSFAHRKDFTINSGYVNGDKTDFPVLIDILDTDLHDDVQSSGNDILFMSGSTILSHEIELFQQNYDSTRAHLVAWVKADLSGSSNTIITMYYGNPDVGSQENPTDVWTNNYSAVWHLGEDVTDEGTSGIHYDSTYGDYYGNQDGNVESLGIFGNAQQFYQDDQIVVNVARGLEPSGDVTISGWFKLDNAHDSTTETQTILTKAINGDTDMHIALKGVGYSGGGTAPFGSMVFKVENDNQRVYTYSTQTSWNADEWYYFAVTMYAGNPSANDIHINGIDDTAGYSDVGTWADLSFKGNWTIGGGFNDQLIPPYGYFNGAIDEVRISNKRDTPWLSTEYAAGPDYSNFITPGTEVDRQSPDLSFSISLDTSAPAGNWTASVHYNDSGSSVSHRVGEYQRNFIVKRGSDLAINSPFDAAAGLETLTVGELLYLVVDLSDTNTGTPIVGASVSMNWTTPSTISFEDLGDGRYSVARNTSELSENKRWYLNISSTHSFYLNSTDNFNLDLYHPTQLSYEWITTTPVGFDVSATLVYRDTWDGSLISGATITLGDGTPVNATEWVAGRYNVTIDANALAPSAYSELFNATKSGALVEMASSNVTYLIRPHYTAVSISGNLVTPYGEDTTVNVVLVDLDTGLTLDATVVDSLSFVSSEGTQSEPIVSNLIGITLNTNAWFVNTYSVNISVLMSDSDYYAPALYSFVVEIRNHLTAVNLVGDLTTAYGANTTVTVSLTDLDVGTILIGSVTSFTFTSTQPIQVYSSPSGFTFDLDTDNWPVSTIQVTLSVVLSGNYDNPTNYVFYVTIRSLQTTLYIAPSNLLFAQGSDFTIDLHFNVSESGTYYGQPINGEVAQFFGTPYGANVTATGDGKYTVTISWSIFEALGTNNFTITIGVNPTNNLYAPDSIVISFRYREIISDLTANLYTVSTPYNMDVTIHLYFTDRDSGTGITTATISANPDILISGPHISNGDYLVTLDSSTLSIGSHEINLTASAPLFANRWVIITIIVTQIHTDADPSTIYLEIPSGNTKVFTISWTDLDNSLPIQTAIINIANNWNGTVPVIIWTGTQYQITFETTASDSLGIYLLWFNFTKGAEYQPGYCEIQIEIRSHDTILTANSPPPTAFNAIINITAYFYDFDNKVGIKDALVNISVENVTGPVSSTFEYNLVLGDGFYTIHIPASQFGLGSQTFTIYVNWTGAIQQYDNKTVIVSVNVQGVDSLLTLISASDPSAYSEIMTYTFLYSEQDSGIGITNDTDTGYGTDHVHIIVNFDVTFNPLMLTISEVGGGVYQIDIDTTGFGQIGQFSMSITIQWDLVDPFYSTRVDSVSVWVLARDTLLLINPPSPESYGENATFSFRWEDTGSSTNILDSTELNISMDILFNYVHNAGTYTITFNTSQFGSVGIFVMRLNITWVGMPFYSNRTNRLISINVLPRQTVLDYPTPDPTFYSDNVTITVTWTDVTGGGSVPVTGATVSVYENLVLIPSNEYSMNETAPGVYEIEFSTSRFSQPGTIAIEVRIHVSASYIADKIVSRNLDVRERRTILSYEAIGKVAYGDPLVFILYYEDLYTSTSIGNVTENVKLEILTLGTWVFTSTWNPVDEWYDIVITLYPPQSIGTPFNIRFNMSYSNIAPFYASDDFTGSFELRERLSLLSLFSPPYPTPYLEYANFTVQFLDVDANSGINTDDDILVYFGMTQLNLGTDYTVNPSPGGYYYISVNSTVFGGIEFEVYPITVHAYWTVGAPYHSSASAYVYIRVTTRDTILDLVVPPSQTRYLDNMTLTFRYLDLSTYEAITSINSSQITILNNGNPLLTGEFTLTPVGDAFRVSINSTILGSTLGTYNVTVLVEWTGAAPYYVDASVESFVTTTNRLISFSASPIDEAPYGNLLNISFRLTDSGRGWLIDLSHITLSFDAQNPSITLEQDADFWIYPNVPSTGMFTIRVDTTSLITPGLVKFDLYVNWNPAWEPYYANMAKIVLEGVVGDLETELTVYPDAYVEVGWKVFADIYVDYHTFIYGNLTTGATVTWTWIGGEGSVSGSPTGRYYFQLNTSLVDAGTYTVTVKADRENYALARTYVTLVITPLPSQIQVLDPVGEEQTIPRGSAVVITVFLEDSTFAIPIDPSYVNQVDCIFQGITYSLSWNNTPGYYTGLIEAGTPTDLPEGSYSLLISAKFRNYAPVSFVININTIQARTALGLTDGTEEEMAVEYTGLVIFRVNLTTPDFNNSLFSQADVRWVIDEGGWSGNFTPIGLGLYEAIVDTTELGYGIWPVSIKARMWDNVTLFADSSIQLALTITRIETTVIRPSNVEVAWGWTGYLTFLYNGTYGPIIGATASFTGNLIVGSSVDNGNGTYTIFVDTTRELPGAFSINVIFSKINYQEAPAVVQFTVREVQTTIYPYGVEYNPVYVGTVSDLLNLQIPIGDSMFIDFFYNDTDSENDYSGGLSSAYATINSYLRGPSIQGTMNITIIDLGSGKYRIVFDSLDSDISAIVDNIEFYSFYIQMKLQNHSVSEVTFKIEVINVPTTLEISGEPADWTFINGVPIILELTYLDTWHGVGIPGAVLYANASRGAPFSTLVSEGTTSGTYYVEILSGGILLNDAFGTITITINKESFTEKSDSHLVTVLQNERDGWLTIGLTWGVPALLIVALLSVAYVRVWNVPKRLRQINGQIKTIRKGKVPKPVTEAASRQALIADLFNDTYAKLDITRTPDQMPGESVPVDVPELGELLIQLAILTNLDQQELDDFKADIVKMKISEQAAFVKEVIVQEAIRAARRDHKTVEEVIAEVKAQAASRLTGEGAAAVDGVTPEDDVETVILPDKDDVIVDDETSTFDETETSDDKVPEDHGDRLSPYEIEELKKDLENRGVPAHEIDVILNQAKTLPRDLVEELIRSLGRDKGV